VQLNLSLAICALVPLGVVELVKAARWAALFGPRRPSYACCLRALVSGQVTNALAPVRAGEVVQLGWLAAEGGALAPGAAALAGTKLIDAFGLAVIGTALVGREALSLSPLSATGVLMLLTLGVLVVSRKEAASERLERTRFGRLLQLATVSDTLTSLKDRRTVVMVAGTASVVLVAGLAANTLVLAGVGIAPRLDLSARMLVAGYVVGFVPGPPGRLGVFETGIALVLTSAGVSLSDAAAAGLTLHVCQFVELGTLFAASLLVRRWSWSA
jgi:uncharacterized membrane protein YbhN (UPF0104 family)